MFACNGSGSAGGSRLIAAPLIVAADVAEKKFFFR